MKLGPFPYRAYLSDFHIKSGQSKALVEFKKVCRETMNGGEPTATLNVLFSVANSNCIAQYHL